MISTVPGRPAAADRPVLRPPAARRRALPGWALIAGPAAVTLAVTLWGAGAPSYWADEIDTVSAVSRSVPQLFALLAHIDAVHGLYYLLLWPVARIAGTGQLATRIPSALAMAAAAAGICAIARRLASRRAALFAGLIFAVLPTVTIQGHDARPYAAVTAAAVLASYLLLRAEDNPRPALFVAYGLALVLTGYLQLFGLLLVPAHAVTLAGLRRWRAAQPGQPAGPAVPAGPDVPRIPPGVTVTRRWLLTVAAAGLAVAPVAVVGWTQRAQISWIPDPGLSDGWDLIATLTASAVAAACTIVALAVAGGIAGGGPAAGGTGGGKGRAALPRAGSPMAVPGGRGHLAGVFRTDRRLTWLAVPWLVAPPLILLAASAVQPVYYSRYVTFCVPAVALLAGAGLAAFRLPARLTAFRLPVQAGVLVLITAAVVPSQLTQREPGGGMEAAAGFLSAHKQPGDAIVYPESLIPPWYLAYPAGFAGLRDLSLAQDPARTGRLYGTSVGQQVLFQREQHATRIWMLPDYPPGGPAPSAFAAPGFGLAGSWTVGGQVILLYQRSGPDK